MPMKFSTVRRAGVAMAIGLVGLTGLAGCARDATFAGIPVWPEYIRDAGGDDPGGNVGGAAGGTLGVNGYLWSATLQTLSFMPLTSADPYGGVVIYDWYVNPEQPAERFKATVYILDTRLRADGLNIAVFKQTRNAAGVWVDAPANPQTETDLENSVLTKARQLRLANSRG